jgi:phosphate transporter
LKKQIYQLEKVQHASSRRSHDVEAGETAPLIDSDHTPSPSDSVFVPLLDRELKKICDFFEMQERNLLQEVTELEDLVKAKEEEGIQHYVDAEDDNDDDDDDDDDDVERTASRSRERTSSNRSRRTRKISGPKSRIHAPPRPYNSHQLSRMNLH